MDQVTNFHSLPAEIHEDIFDLVFSDEPPMAPHDHRWILDTLLVSRFFHSRALRSYYKQANIMFYDDDAGRARFRAIPEALKRLIRAVTFVAVDGLRGERGQSICRSLQGGTWRMIIPDIDPLPENADADADTDPGQYITDSLIVEARIPDNRISTPRTDLSRLMAIANQCPQLDVLDLKSLAPWYPCRLWEPGMMDFHTERILFRRSMDWWEELYRIPDVRIPETHPYLRAFFLAQRRSSPFPETWMREELGLTYHEPWTAWLGPSWRLI